MTAIDPAELAALDACAQGAAMPYGASNLASLTVMKTIAGSATAADWARLRDHAHAIKGVAANLGLSRVAQQGSELMRLADWQIRNEWRQRISMLNAALTQGREALAVRQQASGEARDGGEPGV